jgi:hypothetical protein
MKSRSFLWLVASMLLLVFLILALVLYVAFGPRSIVLGYLFGAGLMIGLAWIGFNYPGVLAVADVRSVDSGAAGAIVRAAVDASDDPKRVGLAIGRILGWCLTIVFGGATCLFAIFAIALLVRGETNSGMTGAAVLWGVSSVLTFICYKFIARAGLR